MIARRRTFAFVRMFAVVVAFSLAVSPLALATPTASAGQPKSTSVIVRAKTASDMDALRIGLAGIGGTIKKRFKWDAYLVTTPAGEDSRTFSARAEGLPGVKYACGNATLRMLETPNDVTGALRAAAALTGQASGGVALTAQAVPNDTYFAEQWGPIRVGAPAAWDLSTGTGIKVGVIDTGVDPANLDIGPQVVAGQSFVLRQGASTLNPSDWSDDNGHGTHVAGIVAAIGNNSAGVAGTAYGARLVVAKAMNWAGYGDAAGATDAIYWVVSQGVKIISISMGTSDTNGIQPIADAVAYARSQGCIVVAASGNLGTFTMTDVVYPAAFSGVVGVGATDQLDRAAGFTPGGSRPDGSSTTVISAPGVNILSTLPGGTQYPNGAVGYLSGTSMSTPCVSGAAAVVWAANPTWTAQQVVDRLTATALDLGPAGRDVRTGYGRLQLDVALGLPMSSDPLEPDESASQVFSKAANELVAGTPQWHDSSPAGDTDWAYLDLTAGQTQSIWTSDLSGGADTSLTLYGMDGATPLASSDDVSATDRSSLIRYTATVTGRYYVANRDLRSAGGGYVLNTAVPSATSISISAFPLGVYLPRPFVLSGLLSPGSVGDPVVVEVRKPGSYRWSYSSARLCYASNGAGAAYWWYRYTPRLRGTYAFRVRWAGSPDRNPSVSRIVYVRVR